jgi:hypothetical protein
MKVPRAPAERLVDAAWDTAWDTAWDAARKAVVERAFLRLIIDFFAMRSKL